MPFCHPPQSGRQPLDGSLLRLLKEWGGGLFSNSVLSSKGTTEGAVINHVLHTNAS